VDLICVGDVMLDVRVDAGELARGGDVHGTVRLRPGGTSANAAVWAADAGASVRVHGRVGDDVAGRLLRTELERRGVDAALVPDQDAPTGTMLVVHEAGERSMVADRGANARLRSSDLPDALRAGAILVSGYLLLQEGGRDAAVSAIDRARAGWVAVETASWPLVDAVGADGFHELAAGATAVLANEREAASLTGGGPLEAARILGRRYGLACVKRGREGAVLVLDGRELVAAADPVEEIDPTGAGDAFDGVLLAALARGSDPREALDAACRAGARVAAGPATWPEPRAEASR
jgi:sugar/nucleoside kinase (ribokinase family)